MGNVIFCIVSCQDTPQQGSLGAVGCNENLRCLASGMVKKWKQQQSLGTSQVRWKMTGWFADPGLDVRLGAIWDLGL